MRKYLLKSCMSDAHTKKDEEWGRGGLTILIEN